MEKRKRTINFFDKIIKDFDDYEEKLVVDVDNKKISGKCKAKNFQSQMDKLKNIFGVK